MKRRVGFYVALVIGMGLVASARAATQIGSFVVPNGINGAPGANGKSAYEIWLAAGHTGTEADFLASLVGAPGTNGTPGANGISCDISTRAVTNGTEVTSTCGENVSTFTVENGTNGTNGTNCVPTFSSVHDSAANKTVLSISGCGESTTTVDIPDGQAGATGAAGVSPISCEATITMSDKDTSTGCYTITTQKRKANAANTSCESDGSAISKQVCDGQTGAAGVSPISCEATITMSDKDTSTGCYTITTQKRKANAANTSCEPDGSAISKQVCDGQTGAACQSTLTTTQCGPDLTQKCPVANKSGVIYTKTDCDNANPTQDVVYNGADGTNGTNGTNGVGVCDGIASADLNKTVKNTTSVYTVATSSAEGYSTNTRTMCDETTVKTDIVQDTCTQIVDTRTSGACDGAYLMCTNQTTNATYYVCKAISGTNVSSISSAISTAQSTADNAAQTAADKVDTSTFTTYQSTVAGALANKANSSDLTTANNKITALETTVGDSTSGLVKQVAANTNDLSNKLDSSTAASTYLSQTNAASTYLTQTNAASTYATQTDLSSVDATARQAASDASSAVGTANTASRDASTALNNTQTLNTTVYGAADGTETANGLTTIVGKTANSGLRGTVASNTSNITSLQTRADNLETVVNGDGTAANQGLVEDLRALKSNYATLSSAYTDLQNRVAAMETCSTCSSGSGVQTPN